MPCGPSGDTPSSISFKTFASFQTYTYILKHLLRIFILHYFKILSHIHVQYLTHGPFVVLALLRLLFWNLNLMLAVHRNLRGHSL